MSAQPLATYCERLIEVRRDFALYHDRVVVRARWFPNRRFEHVVKLAALQGGVEEIMVRYRMYRYAGWLAAVGLLAYAFCLWDPELAALRIAGYVALGVAAFGVGSLALTHRLRRIRFARFPARAGGIGLDIGSAGNDDATFENFVQQVRRRIPR